MGVLAHADQISLAITCDAFADYLQADQLIKEHGMIYESMNREGQKMLKQNPAVTMKSDAWRRVQIGLGKFGLSPSDREKISITPPKKINLFDEFL